MAGFTHARNHHLRGGHMKLKTLTAVAVTAAFAFPLGAQAADDKASSSSAGGSSASAGATKDDGGAEAMFKALDKNQDGFLTKEEANGTPHAEDFATLDKDKDGKLSREEHAAAPEHAGSKASSTGASGSSGGTSGSSSAGGSGKKY